MNVARKKEMKRIVSELETAKEDLQTMYTVLEEEMEEKSEKWKESEAGEQAQTELDNIRQCMDEIEGACDFINEYAND